MRVLISLSGKSLFLYHGSKTVFDKFSLENAAEGAIFLTPSKARALKYGKVLYTVEVPYSHMLEVDGKTLPEEHSMEDIEKLIARAKSRFCDVILIKGFRDYGITGNMYIALKVDKLRIAKRST